MHAQKWLAGRSERAHCTPHTHTAKTAANKINNQHTRDATFSPDHPALEANPAPVKDSKPLARAGRPPRNDNHCYLSAFVAHVHALVVSNSQTVIDGFR